MTTENDLIGKYLQAVEAAAANAASATETTYRTPLENLFNGLAETKEVRDTSGKIKVIHEPRRQGDSGSPDFILLDESGAIIGYVECKKPGENLDDIIASEQIEKYGELSDNALITDYWRFILLQGGNPPREVDLSASSAKATKNKDALLALLADFMCAEVKKIDDPKKLAKILAGRCRALCDEMKNLPEDSRAARELNFLKEDFENSIYHGITTAQFADALAQTVTYTLLFAKLNSRTEEELTIRGVIDFIPRSFDLIRGISSFLNKVEDTPLNYTLQGIVAVVNAIDPLALTERAGKEGGTDEDPYFYFYENFLAAYSEELRKRLGVYYTPPPAVKFIVRATDDILRRDFGMAEGLADSSVTALDFAAGTGTFMLEIIRLVLEGQSMAKADIIAHDHLLKNVFGFEFLISSYVIAQLKIAAFYKEMGIELKDDERINILLTNTLEQSESEQQYFTIAALSDEMKKAQKIKDEEILVVTGNPPYAADSQTPGKETYTRPAKRPTEKKQTVKDVRDTWIGGLLNDYYKVDGKSLGERNPKLLQDDYVKFIRFAQHKIQEAGQGVVAIITNHGFLSNLTFRGMRQSLMKTFDRLYFLDLHGGSRNSEVAPDGGKDENIFNIQTGVAISLLVKKPGLSEGVFRADFWGSRKTKENLCVDNTFQSIEWEELHPNSPNYFFIHEDKEVREEYEKFCSLVDIFCEFNSGIDTGRDLLTIHFDMDGIRDTVEKFSTVSPDAARAQFNLKADTQSWNVLSAQKDLKESKLKEENYVTIAYRPFDNRCTYYTGKSGGFHSRPRGGIMKHMIIGDGKNIGLITSKTVPANNWQHAFVTNNIMDSHCGGEKSVLFPLYYYDGVMKKTIYRENFKPEFRAWINDYYGEGFSPEDILGYIYAILHSPEYREKYKQCLRFGYPRIPFANDKKIFCRFSKIGKDLMDVHLLRTHHDNKISLQGKGTSHIMEKVVYDDKKKRLYFNKEEYFAPIPKEVYDYKVGSYQPLDKYLKSRKGRKLTSADIRTLEKAANAIAYTVKAVKKIKLPR